MTGSQLPKLEAEQPEMDKILGTDQDEAQLSKEIHLITGTGKEDATALTENVVQVPVPTTNLLTVLMAQLDMRDKQREQALITQVKGILVEERLKQEEKQRKEHREHEHKEQEHDAQFLQKMNEMFKQHDKAVTA
ncbi:uncharacterized protein LOC126095703 [Schistocerca cancellata]|uniref:uncharacterized protein LOC126095703 n=1 Tax=Schistocerca cancellata TaxID=274614 RepID=UPI0021192640|nr:uncharacterized protein LOC126095703 [Schistocerca cancellata]